MQHKEIGCTNTYLGKCITTFHNAIQNKEIYPYQFGEHWIKHFLYIMTITNDVSHMNKLNNKHVYSFLKSKGKLFEYNEFLERYINVITEQESIAVSYTHLTLPTICSV